MDKQNIGNNVGNVRFTREAIGKAIAQSYLQVSTKQYFFLQ